MKKLVIAVFVGTFCLGTTNVFAQTKQETPQEKIMRLEIENKVKQELLESLTRKVATLEAELNKQQAAAQKEAVAKKNTAPALKPYYATLEIQQKCEQYPTCAKWVKDQYELMKSHNDSFKITDVKEDKYFKEPKTIHKLHLRINGLSSLKEAVFTRTGLGTDPLSWEEEIWSPRFNSQMYCFQGIK